MYGYALNREQTKELEALCYWLEEVTYLKTHNGTEADFEKARVNIHYHFKLCDNLKINWRVQNAVIDWASDWRRQAKKDIKNNYENKKHLPPLRKLRRWQRVCIFTNL